ncbi:MAG: hypothetical protein Q9210_004740 [Variospora velana]
MPINTSSNHSIPISKPLTPPAKRLASTTLPPHLPPPSHVLISLSTRIQDHHPSAVQTRLSSNQAKHHTAMPFTAKLRNLFHLSSSSNEPRCLKGYTPPYPPDRTPNSYQWEHNQEDCEGIPQQSHPLFVRFWNDPDARPHSPRLDYMAAVAREYPQNQPREDTESQLEGAAVRQILKDEEYEELKRICKASKLFNEKIRGFNDDYDLAIQEARSRKEMEDTDKRFDRRKEMMERGLW